ncbi:phage tail sheath subtilisin-like domain-containing protein [Micromonospora sp. NPDC005299]|uniref:phage tail sheath family protein n=1 Tax=Micromonospora sp. NPDC005299 TaxID=3364231 RepID=UPI0036A94420
MVDYQSKAPGVYVEEITPAGPIAGSGTSVTALIGTVATPPASAGLGQPVAVTNWNQYVAAFGDYKAGLNLPHAVRGFFANGGTFAYVVPIKDNSVLDAALEQLTRFKDVSLVCLPGVVDATVQSKLIEHCDKLGDRFAILDGAPDATPLNADGALQKQRGGLLSKNGFAGLYWPWIQVSDPLADPAKPTTISVPPSGHLAGVMARVDGAVGVHRAPANEPVRGAVALDYVLNDDEQGELNTKNVNALRTFPGSPPLVWGARTLTDGTTWRYVNVRRLVSYIEDSLLEGLRWAIFAPHNLALWKGLERSIGEFLDRVYESGALFGATAKDAYYVSVDEANNPPATRNLGQVNIEIGLAVTRPAEYVVLRVGLWDGGTRITEG